MGRDDHAVVIGQVVEARNQQFLVGGPGAASDDAISATYETLHFRERLGLVGDRGDTVEAGVTAKCYMRISNAFQQVCRDWILNEEMGDMVELFAEPPAIAFEEILIGF